jgi:hypothetical protein
VPFVPLFCEWRCSWVVVNVCCILRGASCMSNMSLFHLVSCLPTHLFLSVHSSVLSSFLLFVFLLSLSCF